MTCICYALLHGSILRGGASYVFTVVYVAKPYSCLSLSVVVVVVLVVVVVFGTGRGALLLSCAILCINAIMF